MYLLFNDFQSMLLEKISYFRGKDNYTKTENNNFPKITLYFFYCKIIVFSFISYNLHSIKMKFKLNNSAAVCPQHL